jgi:hypothetical protein
MPYNPNAAPKPEPRSFKNIGKCIANRIISIQTAVDEGVMREVPEGEDAGAPYWDLRYEALDAVLDTGAAYTIRSGCKLFTKAGKIQDNTQRPFQIGKAFAGLSIDVFPGDPTGEFDAWCASHGQDTIGENANAANIVGNSFSLEKPGVDRDDPKDRARFAAPLPTAELGAAFVFTGEQNVIPTQAGSGGNSDGEKAPPSSNFVDVLSNDEALAGVIAAISGKSVTELDDALMGAGISHQFQINGESVMGAAAAGTLAATLESAGKITVTNGVVA